MTLHDMPPMTNPEREPKQIEQYFVLDFDRTLVDSDILAGKIYRIVETRTGVTEVELKERQNELQQHAEDEIIDMWTVIEELASGSHDFPALRKTIVSEVSVERGECWLPGAEHLLRLLEDQQASRGIITRGAYFWQKLKLDCMGLGEVPTIVTNGLYKSQDHLNRWFDETKDVFMLPNELSGPTPLEAKSLVSVDDRATAFEGARGNISGYWVQTGRIIEGTVDQNKVKICSSLEEVVTDVSKRYFAQAA